MLNVIRAEWTKLATTRGLWVSSVLFLLLSGGWAVLTSSLIPNNLEALSRINVAALSAGLLLLGLSIVLIQAVQTVTSEYNRNVATVTFAAVPVRWKVALAKLLVYGLFAAALTFVGVVLTLWLGKLSAPDIMRDAFTPFGSAEGRRALWAFPLVAAVLVMFAQGLGWILHSTAGAISLGLVFYLGIDNLVGMIPRIGDKISHFSPFTNARSFLMETSNPDAPWGDSVAAGLYVFLAWSIVLWGAGVAWTALKDA